MIRQPFDSVLLGLLVALVMAPPAASAQSVSATVEDFSGDKIGEPPATFSTPLGWWSIGTDGVNTKPLLFEDGTRYAAAAGSSTLATQVQAQAQGLSPTQLSDITLAYFPIAIFDKVANFAQGTIVTRFAVIGGDLDTDAGILFNYQPNGDFLALREDIDSSALILFAVSQGQPTTLSRVETASAEMARWHELQLTVQSGGTHVSGSFDGQRLLEVDLTAPVSGQVGTIAKTDTVVVFDSFAVDPNGE